MNEDFDCPCEKADPDHFLTNQDVLNLLKDANSYSFKQEDYFKIYNCVHCGACGMQFERFLLKQKFLKDGNEIEGLNSLIEALKVFGTPFIKNKSRVKLPDGIPKESDTLLYFGCFTTVKTPKYAENIARYLIKNNINFTIIEQEMCCGYPILCTGELKTYELLVEKNKQIFIQNGYKTIITTCPSCYMIFKKHYSELGIDIKYFTQYLTPLNEKKTGNLVIQHACPMKYIESPDIENQLNDIYERSGYKVFDVPHACCGGGVGHQLRVDIAEKIALKRMEDFIEFENNLPPENCHGYLTTYCPDAFWIMKFYGRKKLINLKLKDPCELLL
jgi:Fe-S oxidoreductase